MDQPLWARAAMAAAWSLGYGLIAYFGIWRPLDPWVSVIIVAAIFASHLPPQKIRPFVTGVAFLVVAAVMWFMVNNQLMAILLGVFGVLSLVQGASSGSRARRVSGRIDG
jgi:hypothetical protein